MSGESTSQTAQNSTSQPWAPAQPLLGGILGQLQGQLPNTGITGTQTGALNQIENNTTSTPNYSNAIQNLTNTLFAGGGATAQAPAVAQNLADYTKNLTPLASNTNYDPMQTPGIGDQLKALTDQISTGVNGSFAAAGRDGSGANSKALGQGLAAGLAPVLTSQYNANVANQQGATNNLFAGGNTTAGLQTGLTQQDLANQSAGVQNIASGVTAENAAPSATLAAEAAKYGIPLQNLGLLANIGIPIAGLGGQTSGTSNTTNDMSGAQQFGLITGGLGSLFKGI